MRNAINVTRDGFVNECLIMVHCGNFIVYSICETILSALYLGYSLLCMDQANDPDVDPDDEKQERLKNIDLIVSVVWSVMMCNTALFLLWLISRFARFQKQLQVKDNMLGGKKVPAIVYI